MDDRMLKRVLGFVFCVFGCIALLSGLLITTLAGQTGMKQFWWQVELVFAAAALAGGLGLALRGYDWARWLLLGESALLCLIAVAGFFATVFQHLGQGIIILTGVMPLVAAASLLWQLDRP